MSKHVVSLNVEIVLADIIMDLPDFDPQKDAQKALDKWLTEKDPRIIEAIESVEVIHHRNLEDQPHFDPFSESVEASEQKVTQSKESAVQALKDAGILQQDGEVAEPYKDQLEPDEDFDWI